MEVEEGSRQSRWHPEGSRVSREDSRNFSKVPPPLWVARFAGDVEAAVLVQGWDESVVAEDSRLLGKQEVIPISVPPLQQLRQPVLISTSLILNNKTCSKIVAQKSGILLGHFTNSSFGSPKSAAKGKPDERRAGRKRYEELRQDPAWSVKYWGKSLAIGKDVLMV